MAQHVDFGYASTTHRAQGLIVDTADAVIDTETATRELLYVAMTRGADTNHVYVATDEHLQRSHPKVAVMLQDAREDVTAFRHFPTSHWKKIWSTNPLERVDKEIKRRTDVVGVFPNPAALLRLAGAVLVEQHEEWDIGERRYLAEHSRKPIDKRPEEVTPAELAAA